MSSIRVDDFCVVIDDKTYVRKMDKNATPAEKKLYRAKYMCRYRAQHKKVRGKTLKTNVERKKKQDIDVRVTPSHERVDNRV